MSRIQSRPSTFSSSPQQLSEARLAVAVQTVIGRVLRDDDEFADSVGDQLAGLGDNLFHRLGEVLAAHFRDCAKRAEPIAAFGDFEECEMPRRDSESRCIRQRVDRRRIEYHPLLLQPAEQTIGNFGDMLAAEHAHKLIDIWSRFEQRFLLPFRQAARNNDAANFAAAFEVEHFVNRGKRFGAGGSMNPHVFTTAKSAFFGSSTS